MKPSFSKFGFVVFGFSLAAVLVAAASGAMAQGGPAVSPAAVLAPLGSGFTYQGELQDGSGLVTARCDFQFRLYDAAANGSQVGTTQTLSNVEVTNGRFAVVLNGGEEFGSTAFTGDARWLELAVRCPTGTGDFGALSPRQELTAAPYAVYATHAASAPWGGLTGVPSDIGDGDADTLGGLACADGQIALWNGTAWVCAVPVAGPPGPEGPPGTSDWNSLSDVPADIADGDDDTTYTAGPGLLLNAGEFSANFGGDGVASQVSRSDHVHYGEGWIGAGALDGLEVANLSKGSYATGLSGVSASTTGSGVAGYNFEQSGYTSGVSGSTTAVQGVGVSGLVSATAGLNYGVFGSSSSISGTGVMGLVNAASGKPIGVYGANLNAPLGWAGYFEGNVNVDGTFLATSKSFRIDHPLEPENKFLYHASVESSEMMNMYTGNTVLDDNGEAWVQLPDWFEALNEDFRYQLTPIGASAPNLHIAQEIQENKFRIAGGVPVMKVSWQVTGVRHDAFAQANPLVVEQEKRPDERDPSVSTSGARQVGAMGALTTRMGEVNDQLRQMQIDAMGQNGKGDE